MKRAGGAPKPETLIAVQVRNLNKHIGKPENNKRAGGAPKPETLIAVPARLLERGKYFILALFFSRAENEACRGYPETRNLNSRAEKNKRAGGPLGSDLYRKNRGLLGTGVQNVIAVQKK